MWPGAVALLVGFVPYYVRTLHVLGDRYGVGTAKSHGRTFTGRPVWEDALHFVAPGSHDLNYFTVLAILGAIALVARRRGRVLAFCAITVASPVLFFTFVPANGDSALFFDRYMIPATPAFMTVVVAGCLAVSGSARRLAPVALVLLVAGLRDDRAAVRRTTDASDQHGIGLDAVTQVVRHEPPGTVLFGSTGTSGVSFSSFDYGHPANLLDRYLSLRVPSLEYVDDDSCVRALDFVRGASPRRGLWALLCGGAGRTGRRPQDLRGAARRVTTDIVDGGYFVVRSRDALPRERSSRSVSGFGSRWRAAVPHEQAGERAAASRPAAAALAVRSASPTASSATRASRRTGRRSTTTHQ